MSDAMEHTAKDARWYVVHTYSGHENKVKTTIEKAVANRGMDDLIQKVSVPMEKILETDKKGKEVLKERKIFPGYVLIKMVVTDESWYIVRNTKGVTGFVGPNSKPIALSAKEVENLGVERSEGPEVSVEFSVGEKVEITEGPFASFVGEVDEINIEKRQIRGKINFFGRETSFEIPFAQVRKIKP